MIGLLRERQPFFFAVAAPDRCFKEKNGEKTPITQKVVMPKIEGAIITAEGAGNPNIKTNIIGAVSAATGLATYKIQVFEMSLN